MSTTRYCHNCMRSLPQGASACPHCGHVGEVEVEPHQLQPGTLLEERYVTGRVLGEGGFGITYLGADTVLGTRVAIKEYYPHDHLMRDTSTTTYVSLREESSQTAISDSMRQFLDEARIMAKLEDVPGVVKTRDFFEANETAYIVMEYLEGADLASFVHDNPLLPSRAFKLMEPIMDALAAMHARGMVHRDVSPQNIKVLEDGTLRLLDFGSARIVGQGARDEPLTAVVKPGYTPVEQYSPRGKQGPWTDVYALCATIYKCITGITPPAAPERLSGADDPIVWPSELDVHISKRQEGALRLGMAVRAGDRFQSIGEMRDYLTTGTPANSDSLARAGRFAIATCACSLFEASAVNAASGGETWGVLVGLCLSILLCIPLYRMRSYALLGFCLATGALCFTASLLSPTLANVGAYLSWGLLAVTAGFALVWLWQKFRRWEDDYEAELEKAE